MATPVWPTRTNPVTDGEQVKQAVANRYPREAHQRAEYLKARLDALETGAALIIYDAALATGTLEGQPVYYDAVNDQYDQALAGLEEDTTAGYYRATSASFPIGIVLRKTAADIGDIVTYGYVSGVTLSNGIDGTISAGPYHLSMAEAGKMTSQEPPITMVMGIVCDATSMIVMPQYKDLLESHIHYKFELYPERSTGSNDRGWLTASHAKFGGNAPVGAVYGYNLPEHPALARAWPPIPPFAATVVKYDANGDGVVLGDVGVCPTVTIDFNGIWWMDSSSTPWGAYGSSSSSAGGCPDLALTLFFTKMVFKTDQSVVTSIQPETGSPITIQDVDGIDATRGDVYLGLDYTFTEGTASPFFGTSAYTQTTGTLLKLGGAVSGVRSLSTALTITGSASASDGTDTYQYGTVTIDYTDPSSVSREGPVELISLDNATEVVYQDVMYVGMPNSRDSEIRFRVAVPDNAPTNPVMAIEATVIGRVNGNLPTLGITTRRLASPAGVAVALPLVEDGVPLPATLVYGAVVADQYLDATSATFPVVAGDILYGSITRTASGAGDGYAGELGLLRVKYIITGT